MVEIKEELQKAIVELRKDPNANRKFEQTVDLIINLQKFDVKKTPLNTFISVPHKIKDKRVAGFLEAKNSHVDTILPEEFKRYSDKKEIKKLVNHYDFFIAQASVMPKVATTFGRALGPTGKMPSPQLGILMNIDDKEVAKLKDKINTSVKIRVKEPSIKISIGKQKMKDEDLIDNILAFYNSLIKLLPKERDNVKNLEIKFTMTKPQKIKLR
ncbi:50S ribosomal protein L1 [uncultured archaeon]|nr:50S ribosomal protein L1 [uncultured archaeon]